MEGKVKFGDTRLAVMRRVWTCEHCRTPLGLGAGGKSEFVFIVEDTNKEGVKTEHYFCDQMCASEYIFRN